MNRLEIGKTERSTTGKGKNCGIKRYAKNGYRVFVQFCDESHVDTILQARDRLDEYKLNF